MVAEEYKSFVVRIWRNQPHHEQADCWHGEIEHIQSGTRWDFNTLSDLLAFLQQASLAPGAMALSELGELWQRC